ncbi:thioesterase II family protein [Phytohabitans suffuscus]|uniref:Thioesterase n=1 Tax=Phytohabitans suffuscus TaxID=624315 RepID=A0A6F8YEP4_9ACTN|nr:alpha/beta fold hydrolase [Phytohabitans suffuscus]BCB84572.1 thioesterase [Phytohabitans suffuscus]
MSGTSDAWAVRWRSVADPSLRLFCVPHSGGGAVTYRRWAERLAPSIEVVALRLPGRETRFREPPYRDIAEVVPPLLDAVAPLLDRPQAWFGHSMGAVVAYEASRRVDPTLVRRLVVAARPAPHLADDGPPLHDAPTEDFLRGLYAMNGTPERLAQDRQALLTFLPTLRADFAVVETYEPLPGPRLSCPVTALGGTTDPVASEEQLAGWRRYTTAECAVRMFPGGHFFVHEQTDAVLAALTADLLPAGDAR